jgi:hypothetical protein
MTEPKRCGTCAYWQRGHVSVWGECRWALRVARPWWWHHDKHPLPEKVTDTEGKDCETWEAKP